MQLESVFKDLSNDVVHAIVFDVQGKRRRGGVVASILATTPFNNVAKSV